MFTEPRQSKPDLVASDECRALEPLLTAYFDGEAAGTEKQLVRTHLAQCARCAKAWSQWQSTRALLQNVPAAVLPPTFPTRLVLACRLATRATADLSEASARDELLLEETLFEAERGFEPEPFAPALRAFFGEVAPPADLQQRILQSTVGANVATRVLPPTPPVSLGDMGELLRGWLKPLRWGGAIAVPALAAWMLLMTRAPQTAMQPSDQNALPSVMRGVPLERTADRAAKPETSPRVAATTQTPRVDSINDVNDATKTSQSERENDEESAIETPDVNPQRLSRLVKLPVNVPHNSKAMGRSAHWAKPRLTLVSQTKRSERADVEGAPGSIHSVTRFAPQLTAPATDVRPVRLASTFQESLADFGSLRNNGIAELNGVVDDYRAALSEDQGTDADALEDDDDLL